MKFEEILPLPLTRADVLQAVARARQHHFIDNLRARHPNVRFDSKLRGYVGEIALGNWLRHQNIRPDAENKHQGKFKLDVDFEYRGLGLELKTSLVPDFDGTLRNTFLRRDLKLIRRSPHVEDLEGEVHIQIFFDSLTRRKDAWLKAQSVDLNSNDPEYLYEALCARSYLGRTYLVGWIDKPSLVERIYELPENQRTWEHAKREFWVCPLREIYPPRSLPRFLGFYSDRLF